MRSLPGTDDDVFLRPPLWEDIASSIQNIDPENANMLGVSPGHVKLEAVDELTANCPPTPSPLLSPLEIKTEKVRKPYHIKRANHKSLFRIGAAAIYPHPPFNGYAHEPLQPAATHESAANSPLPPAAAAAPPPA